uniref:Uncharacterized protein n=1 Tax=Magallana gigas TaxID=29159 RepID=K1Q438_MAGGI
MEGNVPKFSSQVIGKKKLGMMMKKLDRHHGKENNQPLWKDIMIDKVWGKVGFDVGNGNNPNRDLDDVCRVDWGIA